jgi:hypothetical protein
MSRKTKMRKGREEQTKARDTEEAVVLCISGPSLFLCTPSSVWALGISSEFADRLENRNGRPV